jgi:hypothetical protein
MVRKLRVGSHARPVGKHGLLPAARPAIKPARKTRRRKVSGPVIKE